jgi:hypothetical protein
MINQNPQSLSLSPHFKLLSHPFVISVLQNNHVLHSLISSAIKNQRIKSGADIKERTQQVLKQMRSSDIKQYLKFHYNNSIFNYVSNLIHALERMEAAPVFLKRFTRSKTYDQSGITIHRWIQYHYSNYIITMTSIYDTSLLLTNSVFALGLEPKKCNDKTVTKSAQVKQTPVSSALNQLGEITKNYKEPRDLFAHRNTIPDLDMLDELESLRFIERVSDQLPHKQEPIIHPRLVDVLYQSERRKLIQAVKGENERVADTLYTLFTELQIVYDNMHKNIEETQ